MRLARVAALLLLTLLLMTSCTSSSGTEIRARVAANTSQEGLEPGVPLAGAVIRLYDGDDIVLETVLDEKGAAVVEPEPGTYIVQVALAGQQDELCFWGETVFDVGFPSSSAVVLEAGFICAGG